MKLILLLLSFLFLAKISAAQTFTDTLYFAKGQRKVEGVNKTKLAKIASDVKAFGYKDLSILAYGSIKPKKSDSWSRGYKVYYHLIDSCGLRQYSLRFFSGLKGNSSMIIVRPTLPSEMEGTNCGVPPIPDLRRSSK